MPTAKNAKTTTKAATAETAAPKAGTPKTSTSKTEAAKKLTAKAAFAPAAIMKAAKSIDADVARHGILAGVKQSHEMTLGVVKTAVATVNKVAPARPLPFAAQIQKQALANLELAKNVAAARNEFLGKLVKTLVPTR